MTVGSRDNNVTLDEDDYPMEQIQNNLGVTPIIFDNVCNDSNKKRLVSPTTSYCTEPHKQLPFNGY